MSEYAEGLSIARFTGFVGAKDLSRRPKTHGYGIMTAIKDASEDVLHAEEGSLYPALHRLEETGLFEQSGS